MNLMKMEGGWGPAVGWLYEVVVAAGMDPLYTRFVREANLQLSHGARILDLGCGKGQVSRILARELPGCEVLGMDLSEAMIRRARTDGPPMANLTFEAGDALDLPLDDGSVDHVVCVASIKHWPDRMRGLQQVLRVLRPGGGLTILEAANTCTRRQARRFVSQWRYVLPGTRWLVALHFQRVIAGQALDRQQLHALLQRAGFSDVESRAEEELPFVAARGTKGVVGVD